MPSLTGLQLVTGSFNLLNVFLPGESIPDADAQTALTVANDLLSEWSQRKAMSPFVARERFDLITDRGGPTNPYTIGVGGNFNTTRPPNQDAILAANLVQTTTDPEVRIPLGIYTDSAYFANQVPGQDNTQPIGLYYNPTYASGLGSIFLWPVVDNATNDLELLLQKSIAQFADLSTAYEVPDGVPAALKYNVAYRIQGTYSKKMAPSDEQLAVSTLSTFKRSNHHLVDVPNDAAAIGRGGGRLAPYNIVSDS